MADKNSAFVDSFDLSNSFSEKDLTAINSGFNQTAKRQTVVPMTSAINKYITPTNFGAMNNTNKVTGRNGISSSFAPSSQLAEQNVLGYSQYSGPTSASGVTIGNGSEAFPQYVQNGNQRMVKQPGMFGDEGIGGYGASDYVNDPAWNAAENRAYTPAETKDQQIGNYYEKMSQPDYMGMANVGISGVNTVASIYDNFWGQGSEIRDAQLAGLKQNNLHAKQNQATEKNRVAGVNSMFA